MIVVWHRAERSSFRQNIEAKNQILGYQYVDVKPTAPLSLHLRKCLFNLLLPYVVRSNPYKRALKPH